jgi:hypothetical protein
LKTHAKVLLDKKLTITVVSLWKLGLVQRKSAAERRNSSSIVFIGFEHAFEFVNRDFSFRQRRAKEVKLERGVGEETITEGGLAPMQNL